MKVWAASLAALCLLGGAASAQAPSSTTRQLAALERTYKVCADKAVTNPDFGACGAARLKNGDALLNTVWKRVYGAASGSGKASLLAEQRLWIAYKDKSCGYWLNGQGREGQVIHYPLCRATVLEDRIGLLDAMDLRP